MPELPEVEITRRRIEPLLCGRRIARVETTAASYLFLTPPAVLSRRLRGRCARGIDRRGKYLIVRFEDESGLLVHLGMTGQLFSSRASSPRLLLASARAALPPEAQRSFEPDAHTHLRLYFGDGGPAVFLRDVRKFGKLQWLEPGQCPPRLARLGCDALQADAGALYRATRGRRAAIKAVLLDQSLLAGVGNIYADEALFRAGIRPGRAAGRLSRRQWEALVAGLRAVLERSLETGGSSISDYVAPDGSDGAYQDERRVYARTGEPCRDCGTPIKRRLLAQRSAHYCPHCQK